MPVADEQIQTIIGTDQCKINFMRPDDVIGNKIYFNHAKLLEEFGAIQSITFSDVEHKWQDEYTWDEIKTQGYTLTHSDPLVIDVNLNVES